LSFFEFPLVVRAVLRKSAAGLAVIFFSIDLSQKMGWQIVFILILVVVAFAFALQCSSTREGRKLARFSGKIL
jgi:hypothetical protein